MQEIHSVLHRNCKISFKQSLVWILCSQVISKEFKVLKEPEEEEGSLVKNYQNQENLGWEGN